MSYYYTNASYDPLQAPHDQISTVRDQKAKSKDYKASFIALQPTRGSTSNAVPSVRNSTRDKSSSSYVPQDGASASSGSAMQKGSMHHGAAYSDQKGVAQQHVSPSAVGYAVLDDESTAPGESGRKKRRPWSTIFSGGSSSSSTKTHVPVVEERTETIAEDTVPLRSRRRQSRRDCDEAFRQLQQSYGPCGDFVPLPVHRRKP